MLTEIGAQLVPETVNGNPTHALVTHAPVVLIPLGALGLIVMALVPRWRAALRWPVLLVIAAAVAAIPVATRSGHQLKDNLLEAGQLGGSALEKVDEHQALGETMIWYGLAMLVAAILLVLVDRAGRTGAVAVLVAVLAIAASGAAFVQVVRTGDKGASAVWNPGG